MSMTAREYQEMAGRTLTDHLDFEIEESEIMIVWNAIGLAGEAGEVCDLIKKGIFHQHGVNRTELAKELGDVLWYVSAICSKFGISLEGVMKANIEKLKARYPDGYSSEASKNRSEDGFGISCIYCDETVKFNDEECKPWAMVGGDSVCQACIDERELQQNHQEKINNGGTE